MFYDPMKKDHGLPHTPLNSCVMPRPIGWISTVSATGIVNLAPFSYFNLVSGDPPVVMFCASPKPDNGRKDSQLNAEATGEFVFNLATRAMAEPMNHSSGRCGPEVDEFALAGLEAVPSDVVGAPRVGGVAAAMECRLIETRQLRDMTGNAVASHLVIGQVVKVHIKEEFLIDGHFDMTLARTIARCGYRGDYVEATSTFEMLRPPAI